jgi:hypothetical protein
LCVRLRAQAVRAERNAAQRAQRYAAQRAQRCAASAPGHQPRVITVQQAQQQDASGLYPVACRQRYASRSALQEM